jgi:iron(III) transport system substrate-binding protein
VPTNASFQTFVTALRQALGDDAAVSWLQAVAANEPKVYDGNAAALEAVKAGEIDAALVNHYYLLQAQKQSGEAYPVANHFFANGDPGALVNVAGVGILETAKHPAAAEAFARFLLGEEAQTYFATETFEYPLRAGIAADERLPALSEVQSPDLDLSDLDDLPGTLRLLQEAGVL